MIQKPTPARWRAHLLSLIVLMALSGCLAERKVIDPGSTITISIWEKRQRAMDMESSGRLREALTLWAEVVQIWPKDQQAKKKINALQKDLARRSQSLSRHGLEMAAKDRSQAARLAFLLALYYDHSNRDALSAMDRLGPQKVESYTVQPGDTLFRIAQRKYGDASRYPLIVALNQLQDLVPVTAGQSLKLPIFSDDEKQPRIPDLRNQTKLRPPVSPKAEPSADSPAAVAELADPNPVEPSPEQLRVKALIDKAEIELAGQQYLPAAETSEKILQLDWADQTARRIRNVAYYELGNQLALDGKYSQSLDMHLQVESEFRDIQARMANTRRALADIHYKEGVRLFLEEKLYRAIDELQTALLYNPDHPHAGKDLQKINAVRKRLEAVQ